ncbi:glycoside hydrolase family 38 C-terminal domain-containing protein [Pedobacter frigoris]|uniref:glycoside hydrolase family 38 N-terminal domain-containing protein n=1 Tax=Pedobacter frigoris TaxID=2571272 RepID=UPI00292E638B|nr:glycoside hydrolase family 38 C-terminal domain-containing protein [Pedobacter frigoris]
MKTKLILLAYLSTLWSVKVGAQDTPKSPIPVPATPSSLLPGKKAPAVTDIWVVFKTHCDIGYTMSAEAVLTKYRVDMMDNAIRLIDADRKKPIDERFKWTIAGWPMWGDILGPLQTPDRKAKVELALREGSINVHGLPCTIHTDAFEAEDYVRSLVFSSNVARKYGHPLPIAAKMTDVPAHSWMLPSLLSKAGIKFLQIGANYSDRPVLLPKLFWWIGSDGSRILCNYTPHYGSDVKPPKDWPSKNYLSVVMTHDNEGPPSPKEIEDVKKQAAEMKGVKLHLSTLDEYALALLKENPAIPVVRGDMVDPWIHGVMAMPAETKTARNIRPLQTALDVFNTSLQAWGIGTDPLADQLAVAYENSMLYGEHTWGAMTPGWGFFSMDGKNRGTERYLYNNDFIKARANGYYKKFESSFDEHRRYINITDSIVSTGLNKRLALLSQSVKANTGDIIVYNTLPWTRSGVVEVDGEKIWAENIPASGYKTIKKGKPDPGVAETETTTLQTNYFKVRFDTKRGGIVSLIEKASGKEMVAQNGQYVLGQYLHEVFSYAQTIDYYNRYCTMTNASNATIKPNMPKDINYSATTPTNWKIKIVHSPVADVVTLVTNEAATIARSIAIRFTFPAAQPYVDIEWNIDGKIPNTIPEGGWLCFPFKVNNAKYTVGRLGGAMDLSKDQLVGGNRHIYGVNTGTALVSPDQSGVGICAVDAPLMSFGEPGLWKYSYDFLPKNAAVFVNLYNNMWNTNFPYWTEGSWSERVRIWGINRNEQAAENIAVKSWEARMPLLATTASGKGKLLPSEKSGISVSRKGVLVTAFGADPNGNKGTLLRVWEQAGISSTVTVQLPPALKFTYAIPVNLRGEVIGKKVLIKHNSLSLSLQKNGPVSFMLN